MVVKIYRTGRPQRPAVGRLEDVYEAFVRLARQARLAKGEYEFAQAGRSLWLTVD